MTHMMTCDAESCGGSTGFLNPLFMLFILQIKRTVAYWCSIHFKTSIYFSDGNLEEKGNQLVNQEKQLLKKQSV